MFHAKDGWFFDRTPEGDVRIVKGGPGWPGEEGFVVEVELLLGAGGADKADCTWPSIVASVSVRGENAETFEEAMTFHHAIVDRPT